MADLPDNLGLQPESKVNILLVDDNPANLLSLRTLLEVLGQNLVEVHSGEEAIQRVQADDFAVVLLDVLMPGISGFETAKAIRANERSRYTPVIFVTASDIERQQTEEGYSLGAVDFLAKPLLPVAVQAKVRGFVELFQDKQRTKQEADQLRLLVHGTTEYAIFMLDPQGRVLTWNAGAERFKGYKADEIIGQHFSKFYPQDALDRGWPAHELKVATAEGRFEDEGWRVRKDGSQFWANVVITALRDDKGQLRGFSKVTRDLTERKQAEEVLRRSEERFRLMIEGVQDYAIFILDTQGNILTWNAGAERLKGYKADEIIGQHFSKFYPPDALDREWPKHELAVARTEGRFEDEGWRVRKDGTLFWANVVITALRDERGHLHGFSKVTRDLTGRKQAEESLRRSEERFRLLVDTAKDYAIFMLDPQGNIASWNPGAERIKGYKADEIIGQHFSKFYPQEVIDRGWPAHELRVAAAEGRFEDEGWRVRKDGTQFWANVVITALRDDDGKLLGFSKITRDMTERKRAEEDARRLLEEATARRLAEENARLIQEQRERLHVTLASIGDAVISTDAGGRVQFLNSVAENLVGWKTDEAASRSLEDVFHIVNESTRQPVENPALRALQDGKIIGLANHTILIARGGEERPIDDSAAPIRDAGGSVVGSVLVFRDITERKRSEAVLAEQKRVLELLVHGAPLPDVLDAVCEVVEGQADDKIIATMLLADEDGKRLRSVAGRRAPAEYARAVDGLLVGPCAGSCGTAAHRGKPVVVTDIECDPLWADYRGLALAHGLRACWSTPILSSEGKVLGTFAVYYPTPRGPSEDERRLVEILTRTASVAIERKRAEIALQGSEQRFRQLADAMPQIVWTARPDGTIDYLNRRWTEFTGLPDTVGSEGWGQILHPDDATPAGERWSASVRSGAPFEMELRLLEGRSQLYRWHLIRTVPVPDEAGRIVRWFGTATDIQEQKRAEESARYLAEASAALAGVVDYESTLQKMASLAVPHFADWSAVDVADNDGSLRRLAVSHRDTEKVALAHELMRDYPPDPQAPGGAVAVLKTGQPEIVAEITDDMIVQGAKDERHLTLIRSLGLKSYICVPLIVSGNPFGVLTFATAESGRRYTAPDLALATELAHRASVAVENTLLYQSLRDADRRKDEFLATLAHELRNPLAPIRNSLQILKMPRVDAATASQTREMMERQVHHLVRLVDDLLDVSRVMRGKIELRKERVEVSTIIARAVETAKPLIEVQSHKLDVTVAHESLLLAGLKREEN